MNPQDNERLCRVGAQTEMGNLVRRFWVAICLSRDLPKPGGSPVPVRIFNENLVAYRGHDGVIGLLDQFCPHRGASLLLARNEDNALRCIFHGWKFARDGAILETPNVSGTRTMESCRAQAYPVEEASGMVWAYLGPAGTTPPRPRYLWEQLPPENCLVVPVDLDCNWVQSLEGLVDSAHTGILHEDILTQGHAHAYGDFKALQTSFAPRLEVERTDFGFHYAAIRAGAGSSPGASQVRVTAYIAPFLCLTPPVGQAFMAVPIDDTRTRFYNIWWSPSERLDTGPAHDKRIRMWGVGKDILEATGMRAVNRRPGEALPSNRFMQDRQGMESGTTYSGLPGVTAEDGAIGVSMGVIAPRSNEHLVQTDIAVVHLRRLLLESARQLANGKGPACAGGKTPPANIIPASGSLLPGEDWRALVSHHETIPTEIGSE